MTLFRRAVRASIENPLVPLSASNIAELFGATPGPSGVTVTERTALNFAAVYRGTAVISGLGGATPLHAYKAGTRERARVALLENPHPEMTPLEFWRLVYVHRVLWGNFYGLKVRDGGSALRELHPIAPERVKVTAVKPTESNPGGKLFVVDGDLDRPLSSRDVFHVPNMGFDGYVGLSPIRAAKAAVEMGMAAEEYGARLFGNGSLLSGVLQTEQVLEPDQAARLKQRWKEKYAGLSKAHEVAVLDAGATFQAVTMPNVDAQFIESRDFQVSEFSRFIGLPPFLLMQTSKSTSWGTGLEQQAIGFVKFDLHPQWFAPTEARATKELTGSGDIYAKYKLEGLLRGDSKARAEFYRVMHGIGAYSPNRILELEDEPPIPNGDVHLQPLNMVPLGTESDPEPARAADDEDDDAS